MIIYALQLLIALLMHVNWYTNLRGNSLKGVIAVGTNIPFLTSSGCALDF